MLHTIEGPYLNKVDPWRKNIGLDGDFIALNVNTIYLPEFTLSFVTGSNKKITSSDVVQSSNYEYVLIIQLKGSCYITQNNGDSVTINQSEALLLSDRQQWDLDFTGDFSQIVLRFHYAYITPLLAEKDIPLMTSFSCLNGVAKLLVNYIEELKSELEGGNITQSSAVPLSRGIINMIVACLLAVNSLNSKSGSATYEYHVSRIKNFIAQNLREPTLSIETLSNALQISTPHLHRIFKAEPMSISHYIWSKRLQGCVKDLSDEGKNNKSISTIAFSWGFNDAAHFSRVFKEQYGVSPSKWRKQKLQAS